MLTDPGSAGFVEKWLQREPGFVPASLFVAAPQRALFAHWGALLFCLREAAFELRDPSVGLVKTGWWAQELLAIAQSRAQHPLSLSMIAHRDAPWSELSTALLQVASWREQSALDSTDALAQMMPLATAMVAVEAVLLGGEANAAAKQLAALHLLAQRLSVGQAADDAGRVPLQLLARHQVARSAIREGAAAAVIAEYAKELLRLAPAQRTALPMFRRVQWVLDRDLLERMASGRAPRKTPGLRCVWQFWRLARANV